MPTFHEVQLPTAIALEAKGGAGFSTSIVMAQSGFEQRNINWEQTRAKYDIGFVNKTAAYKDVLVAFFRARFGRAYGFRMRDVADFQVRNQAIGTGTGSTQNLQLVKTYSSGGYSMSRIIAKPVTASVKDANNNAVANTLHVYYNGVEQAESASPLVWTIDYTTGILTTNAAGGVAITADFDFDVPVRFDIDDMSGLQAHTPVDSSKTPANQPALFSWPSIPLVELRV